MDLPNDVGWHCKFVTVALKLIYMLPQNEWGDTSLSFACAGGYVETAMVLLEHGAYVDHQNKVSEFSTLT